ncbi:putative reverse transcriptase domain-containing protein, partial [Tanacetum coccineum]
SLVSADSAVVSADSAPFLLVGNQGNVGNQNGNVVMRGNVSGERICMVREGVVVLPNGLRKMESPCAGYEWFVSIDQKGEIHAGSLVGKGRPLRVMKMKCWKQSCGSCYASGLAITALQTNFHELARLVPHLVTLESRKIKEEARQDQNIVTGTFTLNNHFATSLFDSGADYSFVSTTFLPLLGIEPSELGFKYEIEIASGQLVEIDKVIKGCKLEIEGHVFDIDFIPFGHRRFDVINHKAEIICHEKVLRIPLLDSKVLRVLRMRYRKRGKARFVEY